MFPQGNEIKRPHRGRILFHVMELWDDGLGCSVGQVRGPRWFLRNRVEVKSAEHQRLHCQQNVQMYTARLTSSKL